MGNDSEIVAEIQRKVQAINDLRPIIARLRKCLLECVERSLPPESESDSAYLHYCLSNQRTGEEFCKEIRHAAWVGWMHDRGYFDAFFDDTAPNAMAIASQDALAHWLCSDARRRFPDVLLGIIRVHHQRFSRGFSTTLAHLLWVDQQKRPDPRFAIWVSVLLSQGSHAASDTIWASLLGECRLPQDLGVALGLFELLTTPVIRLRQGWDWSSLSADAADAKKRSKAKVDFAIGNRSRGIRKLCSHMPC